MKIELKDGDEWIGLHVIEDESFPLVGIAYDPAASWYASLYTRNGRISTLRIDGEEGRFAIYLEESICMRPEQPMFVWMNLFKAQTIPDGHVFTVL